MSKPRNILSEINESSLFLASLHGVRTLFERELGLENILIATDEMIKLRIQQRSSQTEGPSFPYSYLVLNELQAVKDIQPNKVVRRLGYRVGMVGATRATTSKGFLFPVRASLELKYTDSDPIRVIRLAEAMMILGQVGSLFFELVVGKDDEAQGIEALRLESRLEIPDSITIPVADSGLPSAPGALEVTLSFVLHTYSGFFRDVSAVNSLAPIVTTTLLDSV